MSKKKVKRYWIIFKLANFNLIENGLRLLMTTQKKQDMEKVLAHLTKLNPEKCYTTKNFAVKVISRNRDDDVKRWKKIPGFSLWETLPQN